MTKPPRTSRRSTRRWGVAAVLGFVGLGLIGTAFFTGFEVGLRKVFPYAFLQRIDDKFERTVLGKHPKAQVRLEDTVIPTALLNVETKVGVVDVGRNPNLGGIAENGGGVTSFGEDVLLLPYNGRIYAASGAASIRDTGIKAPDNGRTEYQALRDDPAFAEYRFNPGYLRYNDVEYFHTGDAQGLIASYTEYHPEEVCYTNTLARLDFAPDITSIDAVGPVAPEDWEVIFRTTPCLPFKDRYLAVEGHMASGRLAFEAPGTLYLSSGDFHLDGMRSAGAPIAQDPDAQYGKVLAMNLDGTDARQFTMGHRNVQGMVYTPDNRLITVEHGPQGGDEINILSDGSNYGWPLESYGTTYSSTPIPGALSFGRHDTYPAPLFAWVPSVATSGLSDIHGFSPHWDGDLLVASLIDRSLYRIRLDGDRAVYAERIEIGQRVRDVHQHNDGRIVLWTDNEELVFLTAQNLPERAVSVDRFIRGRELKGSVGNSFRTEIGRCAECHSFQINDHDRAPGLARIFGDEIGSTSYDGYTDALIEADGRWTREALTDFLTDPQAFAPGTAMGAVEDPEAIQHMIDYLEELDRKF